MLLCFCFEKINEIRSILSNTVTLCGAAGGGKKHGIITVLRFIKMWLNLHTNYLVSIKRTKLCLVNIPTSNYLTNTNLPNMKRACLVSHSNKESSDEIPLSSNQSIFSVMHSIDLSLFLLRSAPRQKRLT